MRKFNIFIQMILFAGLLSIYSCNTKGSNREGLDLMKYGIPYIVLAPSDIQVSKIGGGQMLDLKLTDGDAYDVLIFMTGAETNNMNTIKQFKKEEVSFYPNFKKIVEEYNEGFLYEKYNAAGGVSYDFYVIKVIGDKEISFIGGNNRPFTENEVKNMIKTILY